MLLLTLGAFILGHGQEPLSIFENLIGKTWCAEGAWGNGAKFKQEIQFEYSLNSTLVLVHSKGFTNQEQTSYGPRNHGIRKFDKETNTIKFWEFDVFGGVTKGEVRTDGKDIIYTYGYGESVVTDYWEYVDENTYNFTVGSYEEGQWKQAYLKTQFKSLSENIPNFVFDHHSLVVTNLMKTGDFYKEVFGFEEIPHPEKKSGFRWFNMYGNSQLHLIKKGFAPFEKNKSMHLCLSVDDLEGFIERLLTKNIAFYDWPGNKGSVTDRADGVKQIYIQDPEGYWVEINTAKH
ncbi:Catechol 2,3-dioxygenase [Flagellimonas pacifica]|uniref:Catechol 2,3-dioxygenase n=2 Tax=Flagellimonas pacifica TaxID=1247520 RepID=A0A285MSQ3_9FLAO|nr:Catechol 2,3-dioxygenase [Allomuricauda parva]